MFRKALWSLVSIHYEIICTRTFPFLSLGAIPPLCCHLQLKCMCFYLVSSYKFHSTICFPHSNHKSLLLKKFLSIYLMVTLVRTRSKMSIWLLPTLLGVQQDLEKMLRIFYLDIPLPLFLLCSLMPY